MKPAWMMTTEEYNGLMTFREWLDAGYIIKKGSKAVAFRDDAALFHESQVEVKLERYGYRPLYDEEYDPRDGDDGYDLNGDYQMDLGPDWEW